MRLPALTAIVLAACGSTQAPTARPGSRGLHADEHLDEAHRHAQRAEELSRWPDTRPGGPGSFDDSRTGLWYRRWDTAGEEARMAASHHSSAAALHAAYEEACGTTPLGEIAVSPLQRHGVGGTNTADGVLVFLGPDAGPPDELLKAIRCHRAWMMLGERGMEECPLDLAGLRVIAHGDPSGISIELAVSDPKLVPELQRRAAADLEQAAARRGARTARP